MAPPPAGGARCGGGGAAGDSWVGLQSVTYAPVLSKGEGENLTRLLVDTKPESERLVPKGGGATPPPEVSS